MLGGFISRVKVEPTPGLCFTAWSSILSSRAFPNAQVSRNSLPGVCHGAGRGVCAKRGVEVRDNPNPGHGGAERGSSGGIERYNRDSFRGTPAYLGGYGLSREGKQPHTILLPEYNLWALVPGGTKQDSRDGQYRACPLSIGKTAGPCSGWWVRGVDLYVEGTHFT